MNKLTKIGILLFVLASLVFTFYFQFMNPVDGDLVLMIYPHRIYEAVLNDPFGFKIVFQKIRYCGASGYLGFMRLVQYYRSVPLLLKNFMSPLSSVYAATALFVVFVHALFLYVYAYFITGKRNIFNRYFLLALALVAPLFQMGGYGWVMAIVDPMLIVTFGYSFINLLTVMFFLPFFNAGFHGREPKFSIGMWAWLFLLGAYIALNGPLAGPLLCLLYGFMLLNMMLGSIRRSNEPSIIRRFFLSFKAISLPCWALCMFILALALFGEWLGGFNLESDAKQIPLADRYAKLPAGIWEYYSNKGVFLLVTMIVVNSVILFRHRHEKKSRQILTLLVYILLFSTLYTLALPLGGYRFYRPNIIRRDLYEPVSILLVLYFGLSAFHVWRNIAPRYKLLYRAFIVVPLLHFVSVTFNGAPDNSCEKTAIMKIAASPERIVPLDEQCTIMAWTKVTDTTENREVIGMLRVWGVLKEEKRYYQK